MITDTFDDRSPAIINPAVKEDAPEWDERGQDYRNGGQHDVGHFAIALALADFIS